MAKLTDLIVNVITDNEKIHIVTPVTVTKEGLFTTTLPEESANLLRDYGLELKPNRAGRKGFFSSDTLEGLRKQIEKVAREALSRELIEDKLVIKYQVITKGSYVLDDDKEIVPNGYWVKNKQSDDNFCDNWREGNANDRYRGNIPTISVFARVFRKKTYTYKSGKLLHTLEPYYAKNGRGGSIDWINSLCNIAPNYAGNRPDYDRFPEIEATEENAAMFVKLLTFIFQCNELFKDLDKPEYFLEVVAKNIPLAIEK